MNKLNILQAANTHLVSDLNAEEAKLYLILLAYCGDDGYGEIFSDTVIAVLGDGFPGDGLNGACSKLVKLGLIEISSLPDVVDDDAGSKLVYRIVHGKAKD